MREIKFRAWHKSTQLMDDVVLIDFYNEKIGILYADPVMQCESMQKYNFNEVELMQYTGLKDKNGVEIYEGDIVNITQYFGGQPYGEMKHIIKRSKYNNNLVIDNESGDWGMDEVSMSFRKSDDYEVIGNVYEDKKLEEEE